jgi:transcriptional regulator with XRE-family HTH domain
MILIFYEEAQFMNRFGEILAELRRDRRMSQKELAVAFHISTSTISSYETGARLPNAEQVIQFAQYFDVTTDYILGVSSCDLLPSVLREPYTHEFLTPKKLSSEHRWKKSALVLICECRQNGRTGDKQCSQ